MEATRPDALAVVALHRIHGALQDCRRYVVHCIPCQGTSMCIFHEPGLAGDTARKHLAEYHSSHEHVFMLTKRARYYYDAAAIAEPATGLPSGNGFARPESINQGGPGQSAKWEGRPTRNRRDVWTIPTARFPEAHFATYPLALPERCILAGCRPGGVVLDPFSGSGTTGLVAARHGRSYVGIELNREYLDLSLRTRLAQAALLVPTIRNEESA